MSSNILSIMAKVFVIKKTVFVFLGKAYGWFGGTLDFMCASKLRTIAMLAISKYTKSRDGYCLKQWIHAFRKNYHGHRKYIPWVIFRYLSYHARNAYCHAIYYVAWAMIIFQRIERMFVTNKSPYAEKCILYGELSWTIIFVVIPSTHSNGGCS